jgi:preprotein translocase subunit SecG
MSTVLLVIHIMVAIALVGVILLQRSEGGGLGLGSGGGNSFMSVRGTANFLTRVTGVLAAIFMMTSIVLAILAGNHGQGSSILDSLPPPATSNSLPETAPITPGAPAPAPTPEVPLSK